MILILSLIVLSTTLVQPQIKGTSIIQTGDVDIPEMKEIQSKPYFIKRKFKPSYATYERKNKKAKNNEVAELTQKLKDSESATNREIAELKKQLNDSKSATNKVIAELTKQLKDSKSTMEKDVSKLEQQLIYKTIKHSAMNREVDRLTIQLKDTKMKQSATNKKVAYLTRQLKDTKSSLNTEVSKLSQQMKDTSMKQSATNNEVADLTKQLKDSKSAMSTEVSKLTKQMKDTNMKQSAKNENVIQMLKDIKTEVLGLHKFTTTERMKNLEGTNLGHGSITLFNGNGNWEWKGYIDQTHVEVKKIWSHIKTNKAGSNGIFSDPVILPNEMGELYGYFGIWPYNNQQFQFGFGCYDLNHNQLIKYRLPISVSFKIQMWNQKGDILLDYTGTFKITQLHINAGPITADCALIKFTDKIDFTRFPNIKLTLI